MNDVRQNAGEDSLRFGIQTAVRYRIRGERSWQEGVTQSISSSDVLFSGEKFIEPGTPIELTFTLPLGMAGEAGVKVMCHGVTEKSDKYPMNFVGLSRSRLLRQ
jgi:hypothetical protein